MVGHVSLSALNKRFSLAVGLFAAIMVVCTSLFQFQLESIPVAQGVSAAAEIEKGPAKEGATSAHGDSEQEKSHHSTCTIQAISHGIQLHVTYDPLFWEFEEIKLPELKAEIPREIYATSWEYFRILFSNIISPNAP